MDDVPSSDCWLAEPYWARALDNAPPEEGCLAIHKGQWVWVQHLGEQENAGWGYGTDETGDVSGWFRTNIVVRDDSNESAVHVSHKVEAVPQTSATVCHKSVLPSADGGATLDCQPAPTVASDCDRILTHAFGGNSSSDCAPALSSFPQQSPGLIQIAGSLDDAGIVPMGMVSGPQQHAERARLAKLQARGPLDDEAREGIQRRRAQSAERRRSLSSEADRRQKDQEELRNKLARRRAATEDGPSDQRSGNAVGHEEARGGNARESADQRDVRARNGDTTTGQTSPSVPEKPADQHVECARDGNTLASQASTTMPGERDCNTPASQASATVVREEEFQGKMTPGRDIYEKTAEYEHSRNGSNTPQQGAAILPLEEGRGVSVDTSGKGSSRTSPAPRSNPCVSNLATGTQDGNAGSQACELACPTVRPPEKGLDKAPAAPGGTTASVSVDARQDRDRSGPGQTATGNQSLHSPIAALGDVRLQAATGKQKRLEETVPSTNSKPLQIVSSTQANQFPQDDSRSQHRSAGSPPPQKKKKHNACCILQ